MLLRKARGLARLVKREMHRLRIVRLAFQGREPLGAKRAAKAHGVPDMNVGIPVVEVVEPTGHGI
jgi:hypothetical protein